MVTSESFNARLRDELLNGEIFYSLKEAQIVIEQWRKHYNTVRPHSALGYRPPAPEAIVPLQSSSGFSKRLIGAALINCGRAPTIVVMRWVINLGWSVFGVLEAP